MGFETLFSHRAAAGWPSPMRAQCGNSRSSFAYRPAAAARYLSMTTPASAGRPPSGSVTQSAPLRLSLAGIDDLDIGIEPAKRVMRYEHVGLGPGGGHGVLANRPGGGRDHRHDQTPRPRPGLPGSRSRPDP
ncbi:MAG TPA: hypothetical protein VLM11_00175 [Streptosporangiaceae bacterium]|nr:hypothetical protein [Streptosporangiaceae bacterium]